MSHNVEYADYPEAVDKKKIQQMWDHTAACAGRKEGGGGLYSKIQWLPVICASYEEAEVYIQRHDDGNYRQLAVRYRAPADEAPQYLVDARLALGESRMRLSKANAFHFSTAKSAFIGCKACGSKLSREHLRSNFCPLCRADLRPASKLAEVKRVQAVVQKAEKRLEDAEKRAAANGKLRWLVKVEYHT